MIRLLIAACVLLFTAMFAHATSIIFYTDFNRSRQSIYHVSVPELITLDIKTVEVIEAARVETAGKYRITGMVEGFPEIVLFTTPVDRDASIE